MLREIILVAENDGTFYPSNPSGAVDAAIRDYTRRQADDLRHDLGVIKPVATREVAAGWSGRTPPAYSSLDPDQERLLAEIVLVAENDGTFYPKDPAGAVNKAIRGYILQAADDLRQELRDIKPIAVSDLTEKWGGAERNNPSRARRNPLQCWRVPFYHVDGPVLEARLRVIVGRWNGRLRVSGRDHVATFSSQADAEAAVRQAADWGIGGRAKAYSAKSQGRGNPRRNTGAPQLTAMTRAGLVTVSQPTWPPSSNPAAKTARGVMDDQPIRAAIDRANMLADQYNGAMREALAKYGKHGPLISGVGRDHFPARVKTKLRTLIRDYNDAQDRVAAEFKLLWPRTDFYRSDRGGYYRSMMRMAGNYGTGR